MTSPGRKTFDLLAFGLAVRVPFACPGLLAGAEDREPDVVVREGDVPPSLDDAQAAQDNWEAAPGRFLLRGGQGVGRFLVEHGGVTWRATSWVDETRVARVFTERVLAAVLRQRGYLVLHANAAVTDQGVVVVAGNSGAGKSTTLMSLLGRGFPMMADDICALRRTGDGPPEVVPGIPQVHVTEDAARSLGFDLSGHPLQPWRRMKAAVPTHAVMAEGPCPLRAIHVISPAEVDGVRLTALEGNEKLAALQEAVYGPVLADEHPAMFPLMAAVLAQVPMTRIERPATAWSVDAVVDAVLAGPGRSVADG